MSESRLSVAPPLPSPPSLLCADVIVPRPLDGPFTYEVPPPLADRVQVGSQVEVPFGASRLRGIVVQVAPRTTPLRDLAGRPLRQITALLDEGSQPELPPSLLLLARLVATRYLAPWGTCLRLILPPWTPHRPTMRYRATPAGQAATLQDLPLPVRTVMTRLLTSPRGLSSATLAAKHGRRTSIERALEDLLTRGWVEATPLTRGPRRARAVSRRTDPCRVDPLRAASPVWLARCREALQSHQPQSLLLQGTAVERLACWVDACQEAVRLGQKAIVVTPEVDRAVHIAKLLGGRPEMHVALLHGRLSDHARRETWSQIRSGTIDVVVGTRAAVFAPLPSLALLCVDHEEDPALKDEQEPRYHARDVASLRAEHEKAVLLLGSGHPSVETIGRLPADCLYALSPPRAVTPVRVVDLRQTDQPLSPLMVQALRQAVSAGAGAVLYLNRKGFASGLACRDCGTIATCPRCSVTLRYYRPTAGSDSAPVLRCQYCGGRQPAPEVCPSCRSPRIVPMGYGTARLEEEVLRLFPGARIGRLDSDTTRHAAHAKELWRTASVGGFDVLIGTELLFHGPPLPPVGLVGIPHADAGFHLPDFRAAERTYHGLLEATALARPHDEGGQVVLQTYLPTHHAIAALAEQRSELFYEPELAFRQVAGYPPFGSLINLCLSGRDEGLVRRTAEGWAQELLAEGDEQVTVLGPVPAPVGRIRDHYRVQILVKAKEAAAARAAVAATRPRIEATAPRGVRCDIDVDPVELR